MTKDEAIIKLKSNPTVETMWSIIANEIEIGSHDEWYDNLYKIATLLERKGKITFRIMAIESLEDKGSDVKQYFVFISNSGTQNSDYVEDIFTSIYNFMRILKEDDAESVNMCDYMADIEDGTYTWVLSFKVKNIDKK